MQKLYYSISEISSLLDEEAHILRYWEKEFNQLRPKKNRGGNRVYSEKDLLLLKTIKHLLRTDKLSLKGAKEYLERHFPDSMESAGLFNSEENSPRISLTDDNNKTNNEDLQRDYEEIRRNLIRLRSTLVELLNKI